MTTYFEDFDENPGGWLAWIAGGGGPKALELKDSAAIVRSPWTIDFNHAPPGTGYLHLLYVLILTPADSPVYERYESYTGPSRFKNGNYPHDFTNARFTFRIKGEVDLQASELLLLMQTDVGPIRTNYVLHGQPIQITPEWSEQTLTLAPDPAQWSCLGTRGPGADCDFYGEAPLDEALRDININIILGLYPVDVVPKPPLADPDDLHRLRAGRDYPVDESKLASGYVMLDWVRIEFAG